MKKIDKKEILNNGVIQVRERELLELADGTIYDTGKFHRFVLTPDMDINTIENAELRALCQLTWTAEIINAYKDSISQNIEQI